MKVGLISDTHLPRFGRSLPGDVLRVFDGVDLILHAGDLAELFVLDLLRAIAPVEAVAGNVDGPAVVAALGMRKLIPIGQWRVGLTHGHEGIGATPDRALGAFQADGPDVVVFGHSHRPLVENRGGTFLVNPGSATDPRLLPEPSVAVLTLGPVIDVQIHRFARR